MTPREKRWIALISVVVISLAVLCLALYFIPTFLYILLILGISCAVFFYHTNEPPFRSREGQHPRPYLIIPPLFRRWLPAKTANGVPSGVRVSSRINRGRFVKGDIRDTVGLSGEKRVQNTGLFRKEAELSASLLFSPRDILMGSYLGKPDSPSAVGRLGGAETRELRERLSRPNHAVQTPNRRLSFGEPLGAAGRFTITPQRHYPIAQPGCSPMGLLAPAQWHSYRKKSILTPRNSPRLHSPVTVKIARPDHSATRSPFLNHLGSPLTPLSAGLGSGVGAAADPCSRETVLSVLKVSRKREVEEDEDRSYLGTQKSKRRRHGSSESSQSAFEPLTNGTPSHLVPKPGRMKRGINTLVVEESHTKRSRTSSVSSLGSGRSPGGVPGGIRNPIYSSYSSSQGAAQNKPSTLSLSPLSSPGSSRSQTPERPPKKPREEVAQSSSAAPAAKALAKAADQPASAGKNTPTPTAPVVTSPSGSGGSEGRRKRKIPLVPSRRGDSISLPPAPELGYTITVTDLDLEKAAALEQIKKALEDPEPADPAPAPAPAVPSFPTVPATSVAPSTSGSLLLGCLTSISTSVAPTSTAASGVPGSAPPPGAGASTIAAPTSSTSTAAPAPTSSLPNPLLESYRKMHNPSAGPAADGTALTGLSAPTPSLLSSGGVKVEPSLTPAQPSLNLAQSSLNLAQPSLTPAQPSLTLAQPSLNLAQPSTTLAQPSLNLAQPSLNPTQPSVTLAQPSLNPTQPSATLAQPSLNLAQSSSAVAPTIQLPSSMSSSAFSQVIPQPAQSSTTFSLASVVKPPSSSSSATAATVTTSGAVNPLASCFKPIFGPVAGTAPPSATSASSSAPPHFKPIFGQPQTTPAAPASSESGSVFGQLSGTAAPADPAAQAPAKSLFGSWSAAPGTSAAPTTNGSSFQFGATPATTSAPALNPTSTAAPGPAPFQFGAATATTAAPLATQAGFSFGTPSTQASTGPFGGFSTATSAATGPAPASQPGFSFGKPAFDGPAAFPSAPQAVAAKPFAFGSSGGGGAGATPFSFGGAATTSAPPSFGTPSQPAFGGGTSGFAFGTTTAPSTAPTFGSSTQTSAPLPAPAPTFSFGGAATAQPNAPAPSQATPLQPASGGFNFGAAVAGGTFGAPTPAHPSGLTQNFSFGGANNATDSKPAFGTSTPAFGQSTAAPVPFGSPGFAPSPFGGSPAPAFSIGSGSKPSGARQRLQARRQHTRKK
ncbi:nuclear envelope pore membrane protein POM 121 [Anguilla anguilla]|uniref:nuclear envelope pore membrane protein POM 121 n=1 Tax=Anguilla anguilla TaxID=7936 RepID=UPI0015A8BED0|nr:nuclear envelope pore membrane protein POM 121 [Anguilla anguilla]